MKFSLLIKMKMPIIDGIFIVIAKKFSCSAMFSKNLKLGTSNLILAGQISCSAELSTKKFYNRWACCEVSMNCIMEKGAFIAYAKSKGLGQPDHRFLPEPMWFAPIY